MALSPERHEQFANSLKQIADGCLQFTEAAQESHGSGEISKEAAEVIAIALIKMISVIMPLQDGLFADFKIETPRDGGVRVADSELPDINFISQEGPNN